MQHHLSSWDPQLGAEFGKQFHDQLQFINHALSQARDATPQALRQTSLGYVASLEARLNTALVALECAKVCQASHPDDFRALCALMKISIKGQLPIKEFELRKLLEFLAQCDAIDPQFMPAAEAVQQVERMTIAQPIPAEWRPLLKAIHESIDRTASQRSKSVESLLARIRRLGDDSIMARLKADDGWADCILSDLNGMSEAERFNWEAFLGHAATVAPEPPATGWEISGSEIQANIWDAEAYRREHDRLFFARSAASAWLQASVARIQAIGVERFESLRLEWLQAIPDSKPGTLSQFSANREILRGLLWTCDRSSEPAVARAIRIAAEFFYRKNSPLGGAAVRLLASMRAKTVFEELAHLSKQVKAMSHVQLIKSARVLVAERLGEAAANLDDLPLPDSGFSELGRRVELISDVKAEVVVLASGAVELRWLKSDGRRLAGVPAKIKRDHGAEIRDLKAVVKEAKATLAAGRRQLDSAPLERRAWILDDWRKRYIDHPVLGTIGRRVLWSFAVDGAERTGVFVGGAITDIEGRPLEISSAVRVSVWHPLGAAAEEVLGWRDRLSEIQVAQPFKQAHREVYLLTDAERAAAVYSNRFAAHVLKQNQFRALAKARGWSASFQGAWDGGHTGAADLELPGWELRAELWTSAGGGDAGGPGYAYVSTDQVRFCRLGSRDPLPLVDVPPLVFSEVMRDVDLFVGVASIGNDPTWRDGGREGRHAEYWQSFSFGELSESALTRKAALERIVPRLRIAERCSFSERFLHVRGSLHRYRIHLGSGNIMIEPGNQYLCIVPDQAAEHDGKLFLPFEGDQVLSIIISKALLLADDKSIKDPTIVPQIAEK